MNTKDSSLQLYKQSTKEGKYIEYQPNEQYSYHFNANIHNGMAQNANSLILKFSKKRDYIVNYYISGEDIQRKDKKFIITVVSHP